jgi:hypothetical protein
MPPKNPVRAARQAGRQEVKAARQTNRVANIQARTATKVARITSGPTPKQAPKPAAKTAATPAPVSKASTPKSTTSKVRPGIKGRLAEARYNRKAKNKPATPISYSPTKLPDLPKTTIKITSDMRGTLKDMPAETRKSAPAKKKASAMENHIVKMWKDKGYTYGKDGKVRDKNGKTPEENETKRVKDMFLQPGETRANTSPFASKEVAAKRALKDAIDKIPFGKKKKADTGRYGPSSKNDYIGIQNFDRMKNNAYGQAPEGPAKKRNGGTTKRK